MSSSWHGACTSGAASGWSAGRLPAPPPPKPPPTKGIAPEPPRVAPSITDSPVSIIVWYTQTNIKCSTSSVYTLWSYRFIFKNMNEYVSGVRRLQRWVHTLNYVTYNNPPIYCINLWFSNLLKLKQMKYKYCTISIYTQKLEHVKLCRRRVNCRHFHTQRVKLIFNILWQFNELRNNSYP